MAITTGHLIEMHYCLIFYYGGTFDKHFNWAKAQNDDPMGC